MNRKPPMAVIEHALLHVRGAAKPISSGRRQSASADRGVAGLYFARNSSPDSNRTAYLLW